MSNSKYVEFINFHIEEIAKYVDTCFEDSKELIKAKIIRKIKEYVNPIPIHYEWKPDDNPYDCSGEIEVNGYISIDQSLMDFLENEYTGYKIATYMSGMGWRYTTYGDELSYTTMSIAYDIMVLAIRRYMEQQFSVNISDEDFQKIQDDCGDFDEIYDNCIANEFFFYSSAINFVGLNNMPLSAFIAKKSTK